MKIFNRNQLKSWDKITCDHLSIPDHELVAIAARAIYSQLTVDLDMDRKGFQKRFTVFCGKGNNGADGLAIAQLIYQQGYAVQVQLIEHRTKGSEAFDYHLREGQTMGLTIHEVRHVDDLEPLNFDDVVIDCILGVGINKPVYGLIGEVIEFINQSDVTMTVAIDIPSGMHIEKIWPSSIFMADLTYMLSCYHLSAFYSEHEKWMGELSWIPLLLDFTYYFNTPTIHYTIDLQDIFANTMEVSAHSYKNLFGHTLCIGGSMGKMGAILLASEAAFRAGCGLVTAHVMKTGVDILQSGLPAAMVSVDDGEFEITTIPDLTPYQSVCVGCGLGTEVKADIMFNLLSNLHPPLVIDADALNLLSVHPDLLRLLGNDCVLTPHIGEFERLFGPSDNSDQRRKMGIEMAVQYQCYIILKGRYTSVFTPKGKCHFNLTGHPILATAGSGDILAGYLAGFISQGYNLEEACKRAVCLHGIAGDLLAEEIGNRGAMATDILSKLREVYHELKYRIDMDMSEDTEQGFGLNILENPN